MSKRNHTVLRIEGMTCDGCARHATEALRKVPGVEDVQVPGWRSGQATVLAASDVTDKDLGEAVKKAGYRAIVLEKVESFGKNPPDNKSTDRAVVQALKEDPAATWPEPTESPPIDQLSRHCDGRTSKCAMFFRRPSSMEPRNRHDSV